MPLFIEGLGVFSILFVCLPNLEPGDLSYLGSQPKLFPTNNLNNPRGLFGAWTTFCRATFI